MTSKHSEIRKYVKYQHDQCKGICYWSYG